MAETLYVRSIGEAENEALDWYKETFEVATDSAATRDMLAKFPGLYNDHQELRSKYTRLSNNLDNLLRLLSDHRDLEKRIKKQVKKLQQ